MKTALISLIAMLALPLLASCQTIAPEAPAASAPIPYKAHGTEPFWTLYIDDSARSLIFSRAGEEDVVASYDTARPSFNGHRYVADTMTADITHAPCTDGMSDLTYRDSVTVKVGSENYKGCGGGILPPKTLEGTNWSIEQINDTEIDGGQQASVSFAEGRMSGTVGCNRLGSSYQFANNAVSFGPIMTTKMACPDPVGRQERDLVAILEAPSSTAFKGDGTMWIEGKNGGLIILKQAI